MPVKAEMRARTQEPQLWPERPVQGPSGGPSAVEENSAQPESKTTRKPDRQTQPRPESRAKRRKVGLLEHTGGGNLGDDATVAAVLENLRSRWPEAEICAFSMNIEDTEQRHGIPAYPVRRYEWSYKEEPLRDRPAVKNSIKAAITGYPRLLKLARAINRTLVKGPKAAFQEIVFLGRSSRTLRKFDLLLISGGGQLTEAWGGPWCFPYTLFKWGLLARLCRVKCYYINVGAGPLEHPLSKFFVNRALRLADYVSFRDEDSRALVRRLGYRKSAEVAPDCAYSLNIAPAERFEEGAARPVVGFSPMAYCDPRFYWDKNQQAYERMRENLVRFGSWLISQNCQLRLFSTDIWFDVMVLDEVEAGLRQPGNVVHPEWLVRERAGQVRELMARIGGMDCVVTCRFHGVIFAHIMGKPVLALSHHPKVATLMRSLGLSEYCLDMRECDATILQEKFFLLMRNREAIALRMRESLAGYRAALTRQFDALFARDE